MNLVCNWPIEIWSCDVRRSALPPSSSVAVVLTDPAPDPRFVAASRRRDLLLTLVMWGIALTPAWLTPEWLSRPWLVVVGLLGLPAVYYSWRHAPWQPTPAAELPRILKHLDLGPEQTFCDLGAGDGRLLLWVHAATGATCVGIEASPLQYAVARVRLALQGTHHTSVRLGDLYAADLSGFDAVYVWGTAYSVSMPRFGERMRQTLRPGARLVSYHYPVHGLHPHVEDNEGLRPLYMYVLPPPAT
jgi:SAM-dependent methyltransferase